LNKDINKLIDLQTIDLQIKKFDEEMSAGNIELQTRTETIEKRKQEIVVFQEKIDAGEQRRREIEADVEDSEIRIKDRQTKLMNVQTNREYQSLIKEIEDSKTLVKNLEEEAVHIMEQAESLGQKLTEEKNVCEAEEGLLSEKTQEVEKLETGLQKKKKKIENQRKKKAKALPENLLQKYEKILLRRNGLALAGVTNGVCQGCFMSIPPQQFNELMKRESLANCPTCSRLIYYLPEAETE
jgi:predicted  nucleic acid-binding Zn-ribbon protein